MHCNAFPPKYPLKYVNFSMFVKLSLWSTAASKVSINDFYSAISPSNIFILIFGNFTPIPPICQPKFAECDIPLVFGSSVYRFSKNFCTHLIAMLTLI